MATIRERIRANRGLRAAKADADFARDRATLKSTRDELRKMDLLNANPELAKRYAARAAEAKALLDAEYASYLTAHPAVAEKLIAEELQRAARKTDKIEKSLREAADFARRVTKPELPPDAADAATAHMQIAAIKSKLQRLGINPSLYSSPALEKAQADYERVRNRVVRPPDALSAARAFSEARHLAREVAAAAAAAVAAPAPAPAPASSPRMSYRDAAAAKRPTPPRSAAAAAAVKHTPKTDIRLWLAADTPPAAAAAAAPAPAASPAPAAPELRRGRSEGKRVDTPDPLVSPMRAAAAARRRK